MAKKTVGLDIGSKTITLYLEGSGVIASEAACIGIDPYSKEPVSYGNAALNAARTTPGSVTLVKPMFEGSVSDHDGLELILDGMLREAGISRPEIVLAVSSGSNDAERNAVAEILYGIGARLVEYVNMPSACVLGSKADLADDRALISLNIGGGVTDIGVVKGCVTRFEQTVKYGCGKLDAAVDKFIRRKFNVAPDEQALNEIRIKVGSVHPSFDAGSYKFRARDLITGLPVSLAVTSEQTRAAMLPVAEYIAKVTAALVKSLPEPISGEVKDRGLLISGGGALTGGMDELLREITGLPVTVSPHATDCIIEGIGVAVENRDVFGALIREL